MYPGTDGTAAFGPEHPPALPLQRCLLETLDAHRSGELDGQITVYADDTAQLASPLAVTVNSLSDGERSDVSSGLDPPRRPLLHPEHREQGHMERSSTVVQGEVRARLTHVWRWKGRGTGSAWLLA